MIRRRFKSRIPVAHAPRRKPADVDVAYLAWIRTQPCLVCDCRSGRIIDGVFYPVEAAHTRILGRAGYRRAPDRSAIALCAWDHRHAPDSYHKLTPEPVWAEHHHLDLVGLVAGFNETFDGLPARKRAS